MELPNLYVEIEKWDNGNEEADLWVKVPSVSDSGVTTLFLYYDSEHADNTDYVGDTGDTPAKSVWDSDFCRCLAYGSRSEWGWS